MNVSNTLITNVQQNSQSPSTTTWYLLPVLLPDKDKIESTPDPDLQPTVKYTGKKVKGKFEKKINLLLSSYRTSESDQIWYISIRYP